MTTKTKTQKPAKTTEQAEEKKEEAAFDWSSLPEATVAEYTYARAVDVEAETPERIKELVTTCWRYNAAVVQEFATRDRKPASGDWKRLVQPVPSKAMGEELLRLARRYAAFKGLTLRGGVAEVNGKSEVSISIRPKETRRRKS